MLTNALQIAPALMLAFLLCGCAGSPIDNEKQGRVEFEAAYRSCQYASGTKIRTCDHVMETDVSSDNSSGYIEVGLGSGTTSRHRP
jgi:hypothetical protein